LTAFLLSVGIGRPTGTVSERREVTGYTLLIGFHKNNLIVKKKRNDQG
jgi:hypothetical protein